MDILPLGDSAILIEVASTTEVIALGRAVRAAAIDGVTSIVPAARTVGIHFDPMLVTPESLAGRVRSIALAIGGDEDEDSHVVDIPVHYDGPDLAAVAVMAGLTEAEVVELHASRVLRVAFNGFAPGFAYMSGIAPQLTMPRRSTPRTRVPAGSVGLAGEFCGIYPTTSPGGWQLIGRTEVRLWDDKRVIPPLLPPGTRVRFVPADARVNRRFGAADSEEAERTELGDSAEPTGVLGGACTVLEVTDPGPLTVIEDAGRFGYQQWAVPTAGAMDAPSLRLANRLVGNQPGAAGLETLGGLLLRAHHITAIAVTGATSVVTIDGHLAPMNEAIRLTPGREVAVPPPRTGLRTYIAVRGGIACELALGSAAHDSLSGIGPRPLATGDILAVGASRWATDLPALPARAFPAAGDEVTLRVTWGPRADWFSDGARRDLLAESWQVSQHSNRVGVRLSGDVPLRRRTEFAQTELRSEALAPGVIQVPGDGMPIIFAANHPTTGGYPAIACVARADLAILGQLPPGCTVRFSLDR